MILREVICNEVVSYFASGDWREVMRQMTRGPEVRHAHVYADSILHPEPLLKIVEAWFEAQDLPLARQIYLLHMPGVPGLADVYNIHPKKDWGHFELLVQYNPDHVLAPSPARMKPSGTTVEVWDEAYMENFYNQFEWKQNLTSQDERDLEAYFTSAEWKQQYLFILGGLNRHIHSLIETSIHPEVIQKHLLRSLEAKGWEVAKSVSILYGAKGGEFGKITTLLSKPEIMLELEYEYVPGVSIRVGAEPMRHALTAETLAAMLKESDYLRLDDAAVESIIGRIRDGEARLA